MELPSWIFEQAANAGDSLVAIGLALKIFGPRQQGRKKWLLFAGGVLLYWAAVLFVGAMSRYDGAWGLLYSGAILAYSVSALKGRLLLKAVQSLLWNLALLLTGFLVMILFYLAGADMAGYGSLEAPSRLAGLAVGQLVRLLGAWAFLKAWRRWAGEAKGRGPSGAALSLLFLFSLAAASFFAAWCMVLDRKRPELLAVMYVVMAVLFGLILLYFYREEKEREALGLRLDREEQEAFRQEEGRLERGLEERAMGLKEELAKRLGRLEELLAQGKSGEAERFLEEMDGCLRELQGFFVSTGNRGADGAIARTRQACQEAGIGFSFVAAGDVGAFPERDMGILLCNLLDNAREGAMKAEGRRQISLEIVNFRAYLRISLTNSADGSGLKANPRFETDKEDACRHGFGLRRIREIVNRYDGVMGMEVFGEGESCRVRQKLLLKRPVGKGEG